VATNDTTWPPEFEEVLGAHLIEPPKPGGLAPDLDLTSAGIDSVTTIALMVDLETRFAFTFPDEMLTAETFATPRALWAAIDSRSSRNHR
jgi:acyl carrier protein